MKRCLFIVLAMLLLASVAAGEEIKSFCEYGQGMSTQLGTAGGLWLQTWGEKPWAWYDCDVKPNVGFLGNNVVDLLQTWATGLPEIDWVSMIVHLPLGGRLTLTAFGNTNTAEGAGQIIGDFQGVFVVDGLADHAEVDEEEGVIRIFFGATVEEGPDGLIEVTQTSGKFKSIHAVGPWEWHVNGMLKLARISSIPLQDNILGALQNPALILGAEEEIVLSGSYCRTDE